MKKVLYILAAMLLCCACFNAGMDWPERPESGGTGRLLLTVTGDGSSATRAGEESTKPDVNTFLITLYKGGEQVGETVQLKDLNPVLDAGYGYTLQAENCTAENAEAANDGWGQKHFHGLSGSFAIEAGETTSVYVQCSVVNAGLAVVFTPEFLEQYPDCVVKVEDRANIEWSAAEDESTPRVAYFNTEDDGTREVVLLVYKEGEGGEPVERSQTLEAKKSIILTLQPKGESEETEGGLDISATYDPEFATGTNEEVILGEEE